MSDREAFLRHICANPDDDTARLVYADWLQENGDDSQAEFIRCQIEAEHAGGDDHADELRFRSSELWERDGLLWLDPFPNELTQTLDFDDYERGFPCRIRGLDSERWNALGGPRRCGLPLTHFELLPLVGNRFERICELFASGAVRGLSLARGADTDLLSRIAENPRLSGVTELDLDYPTESELGALARSPHLSHLQRLGIHREFMFPGDDVIDLICEGNFPSLEHAIFTSMRFGEDRILNLLASESMPAIRSLFFEDCLIGESAITALLRSPQLGAIERLGLDVALSTYHLQLLGNSSAFDGLRELSLDGIEIPAQDKYLFDSWNGDTLRKLSLRHCEFTGGALSRLAACPFVEKLTDLKVYDGNGGQIAPDELAGLLRSPFPNLRSLDLSGRRIAEEALDALIENDFPSLRSLTLNRSQLDDAEFVALSRAPWMSRLTRLSAERNRISDAGLEEFVKVADLQELVSLDLGINQLTFEGIVSLARLGRFPNLSRLNVYSLRRAVPRGAVEVLETPTLAGLTKLVLAGTEQDRQRLLASPHLPRLRRVDITQNTWG